MDDYSPREKRAPAPHTKPGPLSPAFISMDDAARYAHEKIGAKRTVEYGSVIFQRYSDQLFVASEPIAGEPTTFDWTRLLDRESASGEFVHPAGLRIVASLHSHPDTLDSTQRMNPKWTQQQVRTFMSFYSVPDIEFNYQDRRRFSVAYLSGPEGALLKYRPSGSAAESGFVHWLNTNGRWESPHAHDGTLDGVYRKLASVGRLTFLQSSPAWAGSVGAVPRDWVPYQPFSAAPMPVPCGPVFAELEKALAFAKRSFNREPSQRQRAFILKRGQAELYLASQPQQAAALGSIDKQTLPVFPEGCHLEGIHIHSKALSGPYTGAQAWLYEAFIAPLELATQIAQFRHYARSPQATLNASLYVHLRDLAILRYRFSGSPAESQLFVEEDDGGVGDGGIQAQMDVGQLMPRAFVLRVADAAELSVVKTSALWDNTGVVDRTWRPFSSVPEPQLSPAFISADDAARWAHEQIGSQRDEQYGGVILRRGLLFYATHPVRNSFESGVLLVKDSEGHFIFPGDGLVEAFYHAHPADLDESGFTADPLTLRNHFFSVADQLFSIQNRIFAHSHYFSGPDAVLLKYISSGSAAEKSLYQQLRDGTVPASSYVESTVWALAEAGELWVLIADAVWGGVPGRVTRGWRIRTPVTRDSAVQLQPFFTEACATPAEAVLLGLVNAGAVGVEARAGFVLKHTREDVFVATLSTPGSEPLFALDQVFPKRPDGQARLPSQYRLEAVYVRSGKAPDYVAARETWLALAFFTPAQVLAAARQARATRAIQDAGRGLSLYLYAADAALLKFKVPEATLTSELVRLNASGELDDNGAQAALVVGTLSPRNYVRRLMTAADLWVLKRGVLWRTEGLVDSRDALLRRYDRSTLSRAFLSARDAALYAHERVGKRRAHAYGGYVLKGEDGFFVITDPLASTDNPFAYRLFVPVANQGPLIPPEDYEVQALYGSHGALSMVDPDWVARRGWTREEALINLQVFSTDEIQSIINAGRTAYLSAADDCLLEYTPNGSSSQQELMAAISPEAGDNSIARKLERGIIRPQGWVTRLAEAGDFRVVQGNPLWGPRSVVYSDWMPSFVYASKVGPPDYVTYGAVFTSADEAAHDLHRRVYGRNLSDPSCFAFILKHKTEERYVATEVVSIDSHRLFDLGSLFGRQKLDDYVFPNDFALHGLFRSQQWARQGLSAASAWLIRYFVTPDVLYSALYEANRGATQSRPIYFLTLDGALLRYVPAAIDVKAGGVADRQLIEAATHLYSGQKTTLQFIRDWAAQGVLQVLRTSQCWDVSGVVSATWAGYQALTRRRLSPGFASIDDAVRYAQTQVGGSRRRPFGGVILRLVNGLYAATEPVGVPPTGFPLTWIYPDQAVVMGLYPGAGTQVARYRSVLDEEAPILLSPTQRDLYKTMIPSAVLANLLHREPHIQCEYVFGAQGSILSYQLSGSAEEFQLKNRLKALNPVKGDLADNAVEQQLRNGELLPQEFVMQVAKAGQLRVVRQDRLWGIPSRIRVGFVANPYLPDPLLIRQVFADAPCSPVFSQAFDAVRFAQRLATPQAQVAYGYVLKAINKPLYMTTLALVRETFTDYRRVFVDGLLPQGYALAGVYLCASNEAIAAPEDEMAEHFFAPQHIASALGVLRPRNGDDLPLYLACGDGALLNYVFSKNASLSDLTSQAHVQRTRLLEGTLKVVDYVRHLAAVGDLHIRVTSSVWRRKEQVTTDWSPRRAPHAFVDDPYFHSFCGPLYFYADDAALYAQRQVEPYKGKRYLGAVLVPENTVGFVAIESVEDRRAGGWSTLYWFFWEDHAGFDVRPESALSRFKIAAVHAFYPAMTGTSSTEPLDRRLMDHFVSKDDLGDYIAVLRSNLPQANSCYLSCRGGALLKYVAAFTEAETRLLGPDSTPSPGLLVSRLRALGGLSVVQTDTFWTRQGTLGEEWKLKEVEQAQPEIGEFWYVRPKDEL